MKIVIFGASREQSFVHPDAGPVHKTEGANSTKPGPYRRPADMRNPGTGESGHPGRDQRYENFRQTYRPPATIFKG